MNGQGEARHSLGVEVADAEPDALVVACRDGDACAWRALYEANVDFVAATARRLGLPAAEVDDAVQETFVVAWQRLSTFRHGQVRNWLYRIASNVTLGRQRRRRLREWFNRVLPRAETAPSPEGVVGARSELEQVAALVAQLAEKKRIVFALAVLEGLSHAEIAQRLGCPEGTVRTRLHYAWIDFNRLRGAE